MSDVTHILARIEEGDPAASEQLLPLVYEELRKLAAQKMAQENPGQTLQATALVHEAYVRLVDVVSGEIRPGTRILIENGRISGVGEDIQSPDAEVVNSHGRYAIPGLFDMHVHSLKLSPVLHHPLYIAAGVTAVRV